MPQDSTPRMQGFVVALASAAAFGASGPFMKPLLEAGWSPAAAVAVRAGGGGLVLLIPALIALRGRFGALAEHWKIIVAYGLIAVAGTQVFYFAAIQTLPVGIALLLEYLAPVLLVMLAWGRTRIPPARLTVVGTLLSLGGLVLVVDPGGVGALDPVGVLFGLAAAVCLACYFLMAARPTAGLPPVVLVSAGLFVGAATLTLVGLTGLAPLRVALGQVTLLGIDQVAWVIPMAVVIVVSTVFAYLSGLFAAVRLGSRLASFVGLSEVLFAVLLSWWLLGEVPTPIQALGGAIIVAGVVAIRLERPAVIGLTPLVDPVILAEPR